MKTSPLEETELIARRSFLVLGAMKWQQKLEVVSLDFSKLAQSDQWTVKQFSSFFDDFLNSCVDTSAFLDAFLEECEGLSKQVPASPAVRNKLVPFRANLKSTASGLNSAMGEHVNTAKALNDGANQKTVAALLTSAAADFKSTLGKLNKTIKKEQAGIKRAVRRTYISRFAYGLTDSQLSLIGALLTVLITSIVSIKLAQKPEDDRVAATEVSLKINNAFRLTKIQDIFTNIAQLGVTNADSNPDCQRIHRILCPGGISDLNNPSTLDWAEEIEQLCIGYHKTNEAEKTIRYLEHFEGLLIRPEPLDTNLVRLYIDQLVLFNTTNAL